MNSSKLIIVDDVETNACRRAHEVLWALGDDFFDTYRNPFESKKVLHKRYATPRSIEFLIKLLENQLTFARYEFEHDIQHDKFRYYKAVFKYDHDARLDVHVDAGICPTTHLRKCVTVILYLNDIKSGGELQFWSGTSCASTDPKIFAVQKTIKPRAGRMVMFVNDDFAWHGIAPCTEPRSVITVSFMSAYTHLFQNRREKAFFVPKPTSKWSKEKFVLRDLRADPNHAKEVYVT